MDPALSRLCAIPGDDDLTCAEAQAVLKASRNFMQRLVSPDKPGKRPMRHKLEVKRYEGRGEGVQSRVHVPRASLVRYIAQSYSGDRRVILAAIKAQCPQFLPAVLDLIPGALPLPSNVIPIRGHKRKPKDPHADHPLLFA